MAALTADRNTPEISGDFVVLAVAAGVRIFAGSLVCIDNAGRAVPGGNAGAVRAIGRAEELADNRLGAAGAINVKVARGIFGWANSAAVPVTAADLHKLVYVEDDQTVRGDNVPNVPAGRVVAITDGYIFVDSRDQ